MRGTMFFATLITLLVALPIFFMEGLSGALFQPLAISYILAVLASMLVALILTPALSLILLSSANLDRRESPLVAWLQRSYGGSLGRVVQSPRLVYALVGLLFVVGLATVPFLRRDQSLPSFREPYLTVQLEAPPGTSLPAMNGMISQASGDLRAIPGVRDVAAHVGRAVFGDQVVGINSAQLWVSLDPSADYKATLAAIQQKVDGYSGVESKVQTYMQQVVGKAQTGATDGITLRAYGESYETLRDLAENLRGTLTGIPGVVDPRVILPPEESTVEIEVDLASAQRFGVKPGDVRRSAATLLSGIQVGSLFEQQKVFDVVVWGVPEIRDSVEDINQLLIDTPGGGHVRLGEVAEVRMASSPTVIRREGISPYVDVVFNVQGRDAGAVTKDVNTAIQNFAFPLEYHAVVLGDLAARQATQQRIAVSFLIAVFGIFLFLQAAFRSWRLAFVAILTLPVALAGGLLAGLLVSGSLSSLGSLAGLLTVLGIAIRNQIMLIGHYQHLEVQEGNPFGPELVLRGSRERIAPILMTAFSVGLAVLPFVIFGNLPGHEIVRPMAIVILGGLVTSTFVNLFAIPAFYLRYGESREPDLELVPAPAGD
jgi:Cu/Ag efflux pump CusA